ncbi:MAG: DUF447 family protein [Planctomycetota bacterium]|nr:DUF447 family protein [Planctomycetota bacterium]MDA0917620.1 DUF447 family protein [Planctomycetota bacterium]MDA1158453.1 DUF447 family protein [Planctomycetota bacterium]
MILEGIVSTQNSVGDINVAPMGPIVDEAMQSFVLRPFQTSTTYRNLKGHPFGVLHVVDDVLLLAKAAIGRLENTPPTFQAITIPGHVLKSACRWYEFKVESLDDTDERTRIEARVVHSGRLRDFFGFNRAKHAVLEAAILATRIHILPADEILTQIDALRSPVDKTAGPNERAAFQLVDEFVQSSLSKGEVP